MSDPQMKYEDIPQASREAVHKARDAAQALEIARVTQAESIGDIVQERFEHVLSQGTESQRAIILARVPYICQDIKAINVTLGDINKKMDQVKIDLDAKDAKNESKYLTKEAFSPFRWGLTLVVSVVITTLVGAVLTQIIIK